MTWDEGKQDDRYKTFIINQPINVHKILSVTMRITKAHNKYRWQFTEMN